ncbi:MAG: hypothetical protein KAW83_05605 [Dehalococcoidia bacterium]|nr:hypothetical protein [Dehalococcoidia bacterium]
MVRVRSLEESSYRWQRGMNRSPAMPCKRCGRKTRAWWGKGQCQYCGETLPYSEAVSLAGRLGLARY